MIPPPTSIHEIEACFNAGWDDDPAWQVICSCSWEAWDGKSEAAVRRAHEIHAWDSENPVESYG